MFLTAYRLVATVVCFDLGRSSRPTPRISVQCLHLAAALHFNLALEPGEASTNYEDSQVTYRPHLDPDRDSGLIRMLPDYLAEEITFPRPQASKFYSRVVKALVERVE